MPLASRRGIQRLRFWNAVRTLAASAIAVSGLIVFAERACAQGANLDGEPRVLLDAAKAEASWFKTDKGTIEIADTEAGKAIVLGWTKADALPELKLTAKETWDLSRFWYVSVDVANPGETTVRVKIKANSRDPKWQTTEREYLLYPGERAMVRLPLIRRLPDELKDDLFGMRGFPEGYEPDDGDYPHRGLNVSKLKQVMFGPSGLAASGKVYLYRILAEGTYQAPPWAEGDTSKLFPLIDRFGQYKHRDWPGKIHTTEDFARRLETEEQDLAAHPGPDTWDKFGGWAAGPQLEATGHFRVQKYEGKWWLVDPEGHLFWSHGLDCVRANGAVTPIDDREHYFEFLPEEGPFAAFYTTGHGAPHGYYQNKDPYRAYAFSQANLLRKYGPQWRTRYADMVHRRLRSWGINTIGNWSDRDIAALDRTPYVTTLGTKSRNIEGSSGYWGKFPDPFAPEFVETINRWIRLQAEKSGRDPWCIGYFVDNEMSWGDDTSLAVATLQSPADQPAKKVFIDDLKAKYGTIDKLNEAWGSEYASWKAMLEATDAPDKEKAKEDLGAFYTKIAETYFRTVAEALHKHAPGKLYLGCRFAWVNDRAAKAAAKYCDVVSYNRYQVDVAELALPEGIDKPIIIGEFHFGALDRGMFCMGLRLTANQEDRAETYRRYVRSALDNPYIVGTHWFQYMNQATTGRFDGENYQIGFVDVCDTPNVEIIEAARDIGAEMYPRRAGK
ncbi:hypothetical protein JCM19992_01060 [Thermostilla marina]